MTEHKALTKAELAELRRLDQSSHHPWVRCSCSLVGPCDGEPGFVLRTDMEDDRPATRDEKDLAIAARNALPSLLATAEAHAALIKRLDGLLATWSTASWTGTMRRCYDELKAAIRGEKGAG